jgi:hypothetical protein
MAEGCNLHLTLPDIEQLKDAINIGQKTDTSKIARDLLNTTLTNNRQEFMNVLRNKNHPCHKLTQNLLVNSLGKDKVTKQEENKLPGALLTVLKDHPDPHGLFSKPQKYRGPGAEEMRQPYELLSTAALIQKEVTTSLGNKLKIYSSDRLDFGQKFAAHHTLSTRKKGTIEADTLVGRGSKLIGIDAKYSKSFVYTNIEEHQFEGIQNSFIDGQLQEFYFITNGVFNQKFKDTVNEYNLKIFKDWANENRRIYRDNNYFSKEEKDKLPPENVLDIDFEKNGGVVNELVKKYEIPQIGMCEHVNYEEH